MAPVTSLRIYNILSIIISMEFHNACDFFELSMKRDTDHISCKFCGPACSERRSSKHLMVVFLSLLLYEEADYGEDFVVETLTGMDLLHCQYLGHANLQKFCISGTGGGKKRSGSRSKYELRGCRQQLRS